MIKRREVLAWGLAAPALVRGSVAFARGDSSAPAGSGRMLFFGDSRSVESRDAVRRAAALGTAAVLVGDDVTRAYENLDPALRKSPFPVAGLMRDSAVFPLERLAWDRGLRTVYRGIHRPGGQHEFAGIASLTAAAAGLPATDWGRQIGQLLSSWQRQSIEARQLVTEPVLPKREADVLVSWLAVPRADLAVYFT